MTNLSPDEQCRLDAALARIVDERGDCNDWRVVVEARAKLGNHAMTKAAQDAALKLKRSRLNT